MTTYNFPEWARYHNRTVESVGEDNVIRFDSLTVALKEQPSPAPTVVLVTDEENQQATDYLATRDAVEFTEDGITGEFEGNLRDKSDGFTIEELNSFDS